MVSITKVLECKSCWLFLVITDLLYPWMHLKTVNSFDRWNYYFQATFEVLRLAYIVLSFIGSSFRDNKMNCSDIDVNYTIGCKKFSTKIIDVRKRLYFFQIPRKQPQKVRIDPVSTLHYFHLNYYKQYLTFDIDIFWFICIKKKTFLEIVKPVIIRPRQGDAETGNFKLKKALFAKKVGKNYRSIYLEQRILDQVRQMNHFSSTDKIIDD